MKDIPTDKLRFYSAQHQSLRDMRSQLREAVGDTSVNLSSLSQLEVKIVEEAFRNIAEQRNEVLVTFDTNVYAMDLERMRAGDSRVYLLCSEEGDLQDISPLLPFISEKRRKEYEDLREKYLRSD